MERLRDSQKSSSQGWCGRPLHTDRAIAMEFGAKVIEYCGGASKVLDVIAKLFTIANGYMTFQKSKGDASSGGGSGTPRNIVGDKQDGADVSHPHSDANTDPLGVSKSLDVPTRVPTLFSKGANAAVCAGVDTLPGDIIEGLDALVGALKDRASIQDAPEIRRRLGPVRDAWDCILEDIKEADESHDKRFPDGTLRDVEMAERSAAELYEWAKEDVSNKLNSSGAMSKRAKLQVVPYIVALTYASQIRVITRLVQRDMASKERDKERYLGRACKIVDDFIAVVQLALEGLMADTSLAEVALDYEMPIALYLMVMTRFRACVDAIKSPSARPKDMAAFDDGLSSIRNALHWAPGGNGDQAQETTIELTSIEERLWWARFAGIDLGTPDNSILRTSIEIRELSQVLGAGSDDTAANLMLKPDQKSALLQLPPASALRSILCANIADALQAIHAARPLPPPTFARTGAPPPPDDTMRSAHAAPARLNAAGPRTLRGHTSWVNGVAVCPNSNRMLSASVDGTVKLWSLSSGENLRTLSGNTGPILCMAVCASGTMAVTGSTDGGVPVWSVESGSAQRTLQGHSERVYGVAVSPDRRCIASGSWDKTVRLWNVDSGQCFAALRGHSGFVYCVAFSPDGETLVSGSNDKKIMVWNVYTGGHERTLIGHSDDVTGVAVTPDGCRVVSSSADKTVKVWSLSSGAVEMSFEGHSSRINCVAVFPDEERIASGSDDESVRVWNLRSRALEVTLGGLSAAVQCVAVAPDGRSIVSGSCDNTINVWDLSGGESKGAM